MRDWTADEGLLSYVNCRVFRSVSNLVRNLGTAAGYAAKKRGSN